MNDDVFFHDRYAFLRHRQYDWILGVAIFVGVAAYLWYRWRSGR